MKRTLLLLFLSSMLAMGQAGPGDVTYKEVHSPTPSMQPPQGWQITELASKSFHYTVKLQSGQEVTLSMSSYQLVPATSDVSYFLEPGFDGQSTANTLPGILKKHGADLDASIAELKALSNQLGQIGKP